MVQKPTTKEDLAFVREQQREMTLLGQANALLGWDQEVNLTADGVSARAAQSGLISQLGHERMTSPKLFSAVKRLHATTLKGDDKRMIARLYKDSMQSRKIPVEHVRKASEAHMRAGPAWRKARAQNDFRIFAPHLQEIIELKRAYAKYIGLPGHPYNSLLDGFEEGMTVEKLTPIFDKLKYELVELLKKIEATPRYKQQKRKLTARRFDQKKQQAFVEGVARRMGLAESFARIDQSEHPFTIRVGQGDIRFTTSYRDFGLFAFIAAIHEAGHALYEAGMPEKLAYTVLDGSPSLGLHESQSRFWENMVGKGKPFWKFYYPKFAHEFKLKGTLDQWYSEVNFVEPGQNRVMSDEVHYCLHIILRYELEKALIEGSLDVTDLPRVWNAKSKEFFGREPRDDVEGVLQDVHWSMGAVGYFPTYAIGTMYAAQLYDALKKQYSGVDSAIAKGTYGRIGTWLKEHVHKHGSRFEAEQVIKKATGQGLNPTIFVSYLTKKYKALYGF